MKKTPVKRSGLRGQVAQRDGGRCADRPPETPPWPWTQWDADHEIPLSEGGADTLENVVTRCKPHHRAKTLREVVRRFPAVTRGPDPRPAGKFTDKPELVGTAEIMAYLGVSRQRVQQLASSADFPAPVTTLAVGRLWRTSDVIAWAKQRGREIHD